MPKFQVLCRIDAFADYVAEVDADSAEEAAQLAHDDHAAYTWIEDGVQEFEATVYVTLENDGSHREETAVGDF
jgi:hypothetical protein